MPTIPGASGYLGAATLANARGLAALQTDVLSASSIATDILDISRSFAPQGIGLSQRARFLNQQLLKNNQSEYNALFSLAAGSGLTIEGAQTQILGLRAKIPTSQLSREVRGQLLDQEAAGSQGAGSDALGTVIDEDA